MSVFCPLKEIQHDHQHRRNLTIASLLNDVSVEPLSDASNKEMTPWDGPLYSYQAESSPSCSSSTTMDESDTSKFSCSPLSSRSTSPVDLWNYTQPNAYSDSIIASSFSKAKRKRILPHQYTRLMEMFEETDTPSSEIRAQVASELDMTNREVQVWFQNRRAKMNKNRVPQRSNRHSIAATYSPISHSARPRRASSYIATTVNTYPPSFRATSAIELLASAAEMMRPEI